jgi:hypothetical protein
MNKFAISCLFFLIAGCGDEGLQMKPDEVNDWFLKNEGMISSIVRQFEDEKCLSRVELSSMKYINQSCPPTPQLEAKIKDVQKLLTDLKVVLATSYWDDNGAFNVSILINRRGIAVSGGGLSIEYWSVLSKFHENQIKCGELIPLSKEHWYAEILHSEASCASN